MSPKAKSEFVIALDEVQRAVTGLVRPLGFKKAGRTHYRTLPDGIVHLIYFRMGEYPIGDYVIPGLRESYYGKFAISLGVHLPWVFEIEHPEREDRLPRNHWHFIASLAALANDGEDPWWDLSDPVEVTAPYICEVMERLGLPFLSQFESYQDVLAYFDTFRKFPLCNEGRSAFITALVYCRLGRRADADALLEFVIDGARQTHPGFVRHVEEVRQRCYNTPTG